MQLLVVDDDLAVATVLGALLKQAGYRFRHAASGETGLEALERGAFDGVICDLQLPGIQGLEVLGAIRKRWPELPVVMLTAHGSVPVAVEAMRAGAADFLLKPFDREALLFVLEKALAVHAAGHEASCAEATSRGGDGGESESELLGDSPPMQELRRVIARLAPTDSTVLIQGETGTGKELVARELHRLSRRSRGALVAVHCAGLPEALLESELFGYEKGAFTGAACRKPGRVELAQGGTLFLDEIGELGPAMQVKLLRLLQERRFERLGGLESVVADVRFLAATHRDLAQEVARGGFREDLYYRLSVVPLTVPPLRERGKDLRALAVRFCAEVARSTGRGGVRLTDGAQAALEAEPWRGNVRQLHNIVERMVVLGDGEVIDSDAVRAALTWAGSPVSAVAGPPGSPATSSAPRTLGAQRGEAERAALLQALARSGNNRSLAARVLGISRRTLYNKLTEHGLLDEA